MGLIEPSSANEVAAALREAGERRRLVTLVGGATHDAKGNPVEVDDRLSLTALDGIAAYDPGEMLAVVEGGMRIGRLAEVLAGGSQEWPSDASPEATVGGTIAAGASSPRRLRLGPLRETVVEVEMVTGDGRMVRSGARTVKNVQGYDVHRLVVGSLGTLGAIVRVALKLRPLPRVRRLLVSSPGGVDAGRRILAAVPLASSVVATPEKVEVAVEGWPAEVDEQTEAARHVIGSVEIRDDAPIDGPEALASPVVAEVAVAPSRLDAVLAAEREWRALIGVGIAWVGLPEDTDRLAALRRRVAETGGIAPVIRGPGGLGDAPIPALDVHSRLKAAFDPFRILAPGRFWGGL